MGNSIKRFLSLALAILMVFSMMPQIAMNASAATISGGEKLYLMPNDNWKMNNARFAAYFFKAGSYAWADMLDSNADGIYEVTVPNGSWTNVIFCRMNESGTNATDPWTNKWNQTADLTYDGTNNLYTVPNNAWDGSGNTAWSVYTYVEPEFYVAGIFNGWDVAGTKMDKNDDGHYSVTVTINSDTANSDFDLEFKVTNGTWNNSWGDNGNNYVVTKHPKAAFYLTINFNPSTKEITTSVACVEHASHSADGKCTACEAVVDHSYEGGNCTVCGAADPNAAPEGPYNRWNLETNSAETNVKSASMSVIAYCENEKCVPCAVGINSYCTNGTVTRSEEYGWICEVTVNTEKFVEDLNHEGCPLQGHTAISEIPGSVTVTYKWNEGEQYWEMAQDSVTYTFAHPEEETPPTVTFEELKDIRIAMIGCASLNAGLFFNVKEEDHVTLSGVTKNDEGQWICVATLDLEEAAKDTIYAIDQASFHEGYTHAASADMPKTLSKTIYWDAEAEAWKADGSSETILLVCNKVKNVVAQIGEVGYETFEAALAAAVDGDTIVLLKAVTVTADTTYDLTGITVKSDGDAFVVTDGTLTLNGNGVVNAGLSGVGSWNAIWANGGHVVINGGTYSVCADGEASNDLIYTKNGGTVKIYGGTFLNDGNVWTLNENDSNRNTITVYGGTFQNWNPADNVSEGAGTNFVAEGYEAVADGDNWVVSQISHVAKIGETGYSSLQAAIDAAVAGETITLVADITEDVTVSKAVTIDGANKNYTGKMTVKTSLNVTVQNVVFSKGCIVEENGEHGNLTVKGCTFNGVDKSIGYAITVEGVDKLIIENTTASGYKTGMVYSKSAMDSISAKDVTVTDVAAAFNIVYCNKGTFENVKVSDATYGLHSPNYGDRTFTLTGCEFDCASPVYVPKKDTATVTVVFEGSNTFTNAIEYTSSYTTFVFDENAVLTAPQVFNNALTTDVADYQVVYEDGTYKLAPIPYVAQIGEQGYVTLQAAIDAVQNGETIVLLEDCAEDVTIKQVKNVVFTLDGNNKTYSGQITLNGTGYAGAQGQGLTIKNVNFVVDGYGIYAYTKQNYARNVTVENCSFTGTEGENYDYGIALRHVYNITVKNTTGTGLFDLVYGGGSVDGFTAENVTVTESSYGIVLAYPTGTINFKNVTTTTSGAGIELANQANGNVTIEGGAIDKIAYAELGTYALTLNFQDGNNVLELTEDNGKADKLSVVLAGEDATVKAVEGLNVTTTVEDRGVVYQDGIYKVYDPSIVAMIGEVGYESFEAALDAAEAGDTIVLLKEVTVTADTTYDLTGITVESDGDAFVVTGGTLTLNGDGEVKAGLSGVGSWNAIWANGGHVVINGGTYSVCADGEASNDLIYTKNGGTVKIYGGTFLNDGTIWTLNENDSNRGTITVYGGTFQNWNPADNVSEGAGTNFVADGYEAVADGEYWVVQEKAKHSLKSYGKSLLFEDIIRVRYYFTYEGDYTAEYIAENGGILVWATEHETYVPGTESYKVEGLTKSGSYYYATGKGIPAKQWGDLQYACAYVKNPDGSITYSEVSPYSPETYAYNMLGKDNTKESLKNLLVTMLNYGAAAQINFSYDTENLVNANLSEEQQAWVWDASKLVTKIEVENSKVGITKAEGVDYYGWSLVYEGAINMKMYNSINADLVSNATEMGIIYWSENTYNSVDKLTPENIDGSVKEMTKSGDYYTAIIEGVAAKDLGDTYFACAYVIDSEGNTHYGEVRSYSAHTYANNTINGNKAEALKNLCKTMVIYSDAAKAHFG